MSLVNYDSATLVFRSLDLNTKPFLARALLDLSYAYTKFLLGRLNFLLIKYRTFFYIQHANYVSSHTTALDVLRYLKTDPDQGLFF